MGISLQRWTGPADWNGKVAANWPFVDISHLPSAVRAEVEATNEGEMAAASNLLAGWVKETLKAGPGFVVVRGWPGGYAQRDRCAATLRWLLRGLGHPLIQNKALELLYEVTDRADPRGFYGGSRGTGALLDHTDQAAASERDLPDLLALWCVQPAVEGGESVLSSGYSLHNALLETNEALLALLYEPMPFARPADGTSDEPPVWSPVFRTTSSGRRVRYNRYFVELGGTETNTELTHPERNVLDEAEAILARPDLRRTIALGAGDLLLLDNRAILHNRHAYTDDASPELRRRLLRGWVRFGDSDHELEV